MKKKNISKKVLAILLSFVMIATAMPAIVVGAIGEGSYDPAPYWGDGSAYSAANTTFIATLNADGSLSVAFPHANAAATWDTYTATTPTKKSITNYIFTITKMADDGTRTEIWSENFNVNDATGRVGTFTVDTTEGNDLPNSIYYWPGAFTGLEAYEADASYDVSIQAVDSDGWVSDKIHTLLTETPYYIINDDFSPNESWVVREMLLFEGSGNAQVNGSNQSSGGASSGVDYIEPSSPDSVDINGQMAGMGYNSTAGYRYWFNSAYAGTPYVSQTTWSRSHYNFANAEEVWFYVDLSRVEINKFAFTLAANQASIKHFRDNTTDDPVSRYGDAFSTVAVNGVNTGTISEGIYIQNADGLWESTSMTDGYFTDLSGYKGFIRIPIDYFILQNDQYVTGQISMEEWTRDGCDLPEANDTNLQAHVLEQSVKSGDKIVAADGTVLATAEAYSGSPSGYGIKINPAGTSVTDALILYERQETYGDGDSVQTLDMLGYYSSGDITETTASDGTTTYTLNSPLYAIEDLISAGVQATDWTANSVYKAFYIDQVMFCQKNTGATFDANGYVTTDSAIQFPQEGATVNESGTADVGRKMAGFYDRTAEVPKAVAEYIMQYFGEIPSLNDITAKEMIDDIILEYVECFGVDTGAVLTDEEKISQAIEKLNTLGYTEAYNRYKTAEQFVSYVYSDNAESNYNAVIYFENTVETLPEAEFASHTDTELQETLKQLMAIYETFNMSHFEMLGADAEAKFLELYDLVMGEDVKTGQSIGAYPYIPFNDFEVNYTYGQLSDLYYDDPNRTTNMSIDVNNTKNFVTWVHDDAVSHVNSVSGIGRGWSPMIFNPSANDGSFGSSTYYSRMDAIISDEGFNDSLGATIRLHGELNALTGWKLATLSTTYLGQNVDTWSSLNGLNLSALSVNTAINTETDYTQTFDQQNVTRYGEGVLPNSFVMYVDFTDVQDICMTVGFVLKRNSDGADVECYFNGGATDKTPVIYLLDENGEWVEEHLAVTTTDTDAASSLLNRDVAPSICTISPSTENRLEGYKGFIRIPLTNFRITDLKNKVVEYTCEDYLVLDDELDTHTITQAKVTFWDESGANVGKEIHIDAMGFTYDPSCTTRTSGNTDCNGQLNRDNSITVKDMDAHFQVKTTDSSNFEKLVSTVDPYATEAEFKASYEACQAAFSALSDYQKQIPEVKYANETLLIGKYHLLYTNYASEILKDEWKPLYSATTDDAGTVTATAADNLLAALATVSDVAKNYSTEDESLLELYSNHKDDYLTALGFTSIEEAVAVVDMYEKGYHRLSVKDRESISDADLALLTNAYNAARRAILIGGDADVHEGVDEDGIIADVETFKSNIIQIYGTSTHTDDDADRIPDTEDADGENRTVKYAGTTTDADGNTVNALGYYIGMYEDISIFGKKLLDDDTDTAAAYMNMYDATEAIYDNSTAITPMAGSAVEGGIVTFEKRLETTYTDVKAKIDARTVLDDVTINEIENCLGQYEVFLRRYALVDELNYDYVELALLLPTADLATTDSVTLTNAEAAPLYTDAANADLTYVAARLNRTVSVYLVTDYKWTQTGGTTYDFGYYTVNGATGTDGTVVYTKLGDYVNAATAAFAPEVSIDETAAKKVPTGAQYEGTVKLMAFDSALITDGVDVSTLEPVSTVEIPVMFVSTDGANPVFYTVSIPADMEVEWDQTTPENASYTVNNASLNGGTLTVGVADNTDHAGQLTNTVTDDVLTYTATNFKETVFDQDITTDTKPTDEPSVTVSGWDEVPVGEYRTTLTYTVVYDDGTDDSTT